MRQIILDTETTGLDPKDGHRIIEIGCIELINRKFTNNRYHQYINPEREIEQEAMNVHGITNEFLKDKPTFANIADDFMNFIQGAELIIHNAPFDTGFINHELKNHAKQWKSITQHCHIIDTLVLARQLHVGQRNSLDALCKRYSIDNSKRDYHGALLDAHLLAQVYLAMTGGQASLFDDLPDDETTTTTTTTITDATVPQTTRQRKLVVIHADEKELQAHHTYLQQSVEASTK